MSDDALTAIAEAAEREADPDDVLREAVRVLASQPGASGASIAFAEDGELLPGPEAGTADPARRTTVPVVYQGAVVGELRVDGEADRALLERVAELIAAHVLLGWDTGGETWVP